MNERILIVDDDEKVRNLVSIYLNIQNLQLQG